MVLKIRKLSPFPGRRRKQKKKQQKEWVTSQQQKLQHDDKALTSMLETMMMSSEDEPVHPPPPIQQTKTFDRPPQIMPSDSDVSSLALISPTDTRPPQRRWGRQKNHPTSASEHFWSTKIEPKLLEKVDPKTNPPGSLKLEATKAHRRAVAVAKSMFAAVWEKDGIPVAHQEVQRAFAHADAAEKAYQKDLQEQKNTSADEYFEQGCQLWQDAQYDPALECLCRALEIQEEKERQLQVVTPEEQTQKTNYRLERAKTMYSLAAVYFSKKEYKQALLNFRRALRIFYIDLGKKHTLTKSSTLMMSDVFTALMDSKQEPSFRDEELEQIESSTKEAEKIPGSITTIFEARSDASEADEEDSTSEEERDETPSAQDTSNAKTDDETKRIKREKAKRYMKAIFRSVEHERRGDVELEHNDLSRAMVEYVSSIAHGPADSHPGKLAYVVLFLLTCFL